ncbi:MAG TPA: glycosyltransferase family 39 protein [Geobacteraceae bacterium]
MKFLSDFLTRKEGRYRTDLSLLLVVFGTAFFQFLGRIPLLEPDEGRYAEIPREMIERGDFITPHLNYVKYFEKPPLHYWLNALSFELFGQNEFAARFPGALMGLLTVLLTYHAGRTLFGRRAGLLAALILGTATGFLVQARLDITDMTLTCTLSAALAFFILAARDGERRAGLYYHLSYIAAALAILAKGLIGIVFPGAIIFLHLLITRRWRLLGEMRLATGIPLLLLVAAPWFVLVSLRNPEFARFFFIHEHFERFLTKVHGRYQPFWFFIPVLAGTMLPWSFFIPSALKGTWRDRKSPEGESRLYLAIWAVFIFLFFSKSDSKLVPYILPVFPPLALLMGSAWSDGAASLAKPVKIEGYAVAAFLAVLGIGGIVYPFAAPHPEISAGGGALIGGIFLCEGVIAFRNTHRGSSMALFAGLLFCSYVLGIAAPPFILSGVAQKKSLKELGLAISEKAGKDAVIASFGLQQGLSFYTGRRVVIVGNMNELEFGCRQGDNSAWFLDLPCFGRLWDSPSPVFAVLSQEELASLRKEVRTVPRIVAQSGKKILVANR